jgi:hypothetical protein
MPFYMTYFPEIGQSYEDANAICANSPSDAAEMAADAKCRNDAEWRDLLVVVRDTSGDHHTFHVGVICRPEFVARRVNSSSLICNPDPSR